MAPKQVTQGDDESPAVRAFPADKLGFFLRAMADPDARGELSDDERRKIADIEARIAERRGRTRPGPAPS